MAASVFASTAVAKDDVVCPGGAVAGFGELAERLEEYDGFTVLSAEMLVSPTRACRETWIVEVLTPDDEVMALVFDARTLEERFAGSGRDDDDDDEDDDLFPVSIRMAGGSTIEWFEGDWSDDVMEGGPGPDLFVLTPGTDLILDFTPGEDLLDVGDFARRADGFGVLRSMEDISRRSQLVEIDGRKGTQIDIDGDHGDWTVTLIGVPLGGLTAESVFFGIDGDASPELRKTHWPARTTEFSDGSIVYVPSYPIDEEPPEAWLVSGDEDALELIEERLEDLYEFLEDDD
ncbi:MAG: hypothetical protein AAFU49_04585 [Pseudomonadota bacterium]